jgi:NADPH:quinone reductase-like Zn-dependent oxidoreductase
MRKRPLVTGSTLRPRTPEQKGEITRTMLKVWPLLANGTVKPLVYRTFPLNDAAKAHALLESSEHIGEIVLTHPRQNSKYGEGGSTRIDQQSLG